MGDEGAGVRDWLLGPGVASEEVLVVSPKANYGSTLESQNIEQNPKQDSFAPRSLISRRVLLSYAMGHVLNDMCASCWFTYLLVYLEKVSMLSSTQAGIVLLAGQVADAIATPLVGILSDATGKFVWKLGSFSFGRRKLWHFIGSITVILCFFLVFCFEYLVEIPLTTLVAFYAVSASLFNIGWATIQVSHMAMVPELSRVSRDRVALTSARYAMTVLSNVAVFLIFFVLLQLFPENRDFQFFLLGLSVLIVGSLATVIFHSGTPEGTLDSSGSENQTEESVKFNWWDWLKSRIYFQVAFIYMTTRIVVNVSQVFLPFFVDDVLEMHALNDQAITTVPLVLYISSFFGSLAMNRLNQKFGRRGGYILGGLVSIVPLISMFFLTKEVSYFVYVAVIVLGFGSSIIMVCSVSLESDLVGDRVSTGAFVFGSLSFTDKLSNGLIIFAIQNRDQVSKHIVMLSETLIPAAAAACGVIMAFFTVIPR